MRAAYFEMVGGASGNMILGALADAGADLDAIESRLRTIPVESEWTLERTRTVRRGIAAMHVDFTIEGDVHGHGHDHHHRHLADVLRIVEGSQLTREQKARASGIYTRLADAEARVHGTTREEIHFHEVGSVDAILDVAAACIGLDLLGVERAYASAYPIGTGSISMHHGIYPNPPPATAELMRGAPTRTVDVQGELVTTTAAAIFATIVERPGDRPAITYDAIGYGAGTNDFPIPNVLRVTIGETAAAAPTRDTVVVLEANVDDLSPQYFELAFERVFAAGAYDAWLAPVTMKKLRPAVIFGVLAPPERADACARVMLENTSTLGVRRRTDERDVLPRRIEERVTPLGVVAVKIASVDGHDRAMLEYDSVVKIARASGRPIGEVARELEPYLRTS